MVSWLVHGPWMDPDGFNFPQTQLFQPKALLPILVAGTRLNAALLIAIGALVAGWIFMNRSFMGYQMKVAGQAENASRYAGFSAKRAVWLGMLVGGGMAGIAGISEVAGPIGQITEHISPGYGFAAMIVAFVGRLSPIGIFFSSLLMALLYMGGEQAQQYLALPYSISKVFQGMLLFFLLGSDVFIHFRPRWVGRKK
jgi:simple sugar transport system permease protein